MDIKTILDAMEDAKHEADWYWSVINAPGYEEENKRKHGRKLRQYRAFRARILRMDAELRQFARLSRDRIITLEQRLAAKDERITTLENLRALYVEQLATKDAEIDEKEDLIDGQRKTIRLRDRQIREKDARIAELEAELASLKEWVDAEIENHPPYP